MSPLIPVCTPNRKLLKYLQGRKAVFQVGSYALINEVFSLSQQYDVHLHGIIVVSSVSVASVNFELAHRELPLAFFAPELGRFRELVTKLGSLRELNIRVYLPVNRAENLAGLRILSSLGIASAAVFQGKNIDWENLTDLMTYALLGKIPHAPIEPFQYLAERYSPNVRNDFSAVYFNDPTRYVHVDDEGRIALSNQDLEDQCFVSTDLKELASLPDTQEYKERSERWRYFFLQAEGCAYCEAWRICLGKFSEYPKQNDGCSGFFKEFLAAIELYQEAKNGRVMLWQP